MAGIPAWPESLVMIRVSSKICANTKTKSTTDPGTHYYPAAPEGKFHPAQHLISCQLEHPVVVKQPSIKSYFDLDVSQLEMNFAFK